MAMRHTPGPLGGSLAPGGTLARTASALPGPSGLAAGTGTPDAHGPDLQPYEWQELGFLSPPRSETPGGRRLFRVWGGTSLERGDPRGRGVFYSFERPTSRRDAERRFAIAEFGNSCLFVSEFEAPPDTTVWVGRVDPGESVHPDLGGAAEQVFIRNPWAQRLVQVGASSRLEDDLGGAWVYSGPKTREPAQDAEGSWN